MSKFKFVPVWECLECKARVRQLEVPNSCWCCVVRDKEIKEHHMEEGRLGIE